jgi:DNA (cytosine-5)-methyltransferase 1
MKYLSLCSGIEAATVAWHPLGWEAVAYSEIEKFPSQVLAHHYPQTPNLGDMTKFKEWSIESNVDLLVGGTPCQSFSVAGLRKGLDDPRGNLMLTYLAIADKYRPRWLVWENVPGVLSSNGGQDFGVFLGALGELGYGFAYRVLDAQYFGVAQRRRRVFVVGYLGDWRLAAAVLFERHSLSGNPAPSRKKGEDIAASARTGAAIGSHWDGDFPHPTLNQSASNSGGVGSSNQEIFSQRGAYLAPAKQWPPEIAPTIDAHFGTKQGLENQHINAGGGMFTISKQMSDNQKQDGCRNRDIDSYYRGSL